MSEFETPSQRVISSFPPFNNENALSLLKAPDRSFHFRPTLSEPLSIDGEEGKKAPVTAFAVQRAIDLELAGIGLADILGVNDRQRNMPHDVLEICRDKLGTGTPFTIYQTRYTRAGYSYVVTMSDLVVTSTFNHGLYMEVGEQLATLERGEKKAAIASVGESLGNAFAIPAAIRSGMVKNDIHMLFPGSSGAINTLERILRSGEFYNPDTHNRVVSALADNGATVNVDDPLWLLYGQEKSDTPSISIRSLAELSVLVLRKGGNRSFDFERGWQRFDNLLGLAATSVKSVKLSTLRKQPAHLVGENLRETGAVVHDFVYNQ